MIFILQLVGNAVRCNNEGAFFRNEKFSKFMFLLGKLSKSFTFTVGMCLLLYLLKISGSVNYVSVFLKIPESIQAWSLA